MNQEQIKTKATELAALYAAKSAELAALYTAKANGRTLQIECNDGWKGCDDCNGPTMQSDLSRWRVKPEPRRMWETFSATPFRTDSYVRTYHQDEADTWKSKGCTVTEWLEVLP
jgi:hypothetical protein